MGEQAAVQASEQVSGQQCKQWRRQKCGQRCRQQCGQRCQAGGQECRVAAVQAGRQQCRQAGSSSAGRLPPAGDKQLHSYFSWLPGKRVPSR